MLLWYMCVGKRGRDGIYMVGVGVGGREGWWRGNGKRERKRDRSIYIYIYIEGGGGGGG